MEINEYLNTQSLQSTTGLSTLTNSVNLESLEKIQAATTKPTDTFSLEIEGVQKRSNLSYVLQPVMAEMQDLQKTLTSLNEQSTILDQLSLASMSDITSNSMQSLEDLQPSVEELMQKYNYLSSDINKNFEKYQEETSSQNYFDGMLGAKPLNPQEIIAAVKEQQQVVREEKKFFSNEIEKIEKKAKEVINSEIEKSKQEAPFKNIDFGKNTANFTSANINTIVGSVVYSQANATPANSPKLLA